MAIAATVNLGLVIFNLTYISGRDFYLRYLPGLTQAYDPIKGIEPHRDTQHYLNTVNALTQQVNQTGIQSPQAARLLEELRRLSSEMIDTNPFEIANKTGTLEKIKNRMRDRLHQESSRQAFYIFWSQAYLSQGRWQPEIDFFNRSIQPLLATNYYRHIGENGEFVDEFWRIDLPFIALFGLEFLARTFYISRRHVGIRWIDAMLWRWYDIFLLLPFWRWLRIIPVIIRLHQAKLLDLQPVQRQISAGFVTNFAEELTEVVVVRIINQLQSAIKQGAATRWLLQDENRRAYIDINQVNELEAIAQLLFHKTIYQVLPEIEPDLIALLHHNLETILKQSPLYQTMQNLPGLENISTQLSQQLATGITHNAYKAVVNAVEDPVGAKLSSQVVQHFSQALGDEIQQKQTLEEIQALLADLLEELKLNYFKQLADEDVEQTMEQTRQLRRKALIEQTFGRNSLLSKTGKK